MMVKGKSKAKNDKPTPQEFINAYNKLCKKMGYKIVVEPSWKLRDDNTWSVVLKTSIGQANQNE